MQSSPMATSPWSPMSWMKGLPDSILVSDINIPGTHDSAAIRSIVPTPYRCQDLSIGAQLGYGSRLLDVRIQVTPTTQPNSFLFVTCHGARGFTINLNTYQTLDSLLTECRNFLTSNSSEFIVMSLKIDDWTTVPPANQQTALAALRSQALSPYANFIDFGSSAMPNLGQARGKILLFDRTGASPALGIQLNIGDNTEGSFAGPANPNRSYQIWVQDKYEGLPFWFPAQAKMLLVQQAFNCKRPGEIVWNFASATWQSIWGVYVMDDLLTSFGAQPASQRPRNLGWILFDFPDSWYPTAEYGSMSVLRLIVDSNFNYQMYPGPFCKVRTTDPRGASSL